ncbi:MAG: hypothetical protein KQH59_18195 [Desulfobulbaceae bacterium]|nr:hypothetical protein [Desulfobulbaceae bacterium]
MAAKKQTAQPTTVALVVPVDNHEHRGEKLAKGDTIRVTPEQKDRLEKLWSVKPAA